MKQHPDFPRYYISEDGKIFSSNGPFKELKQCLNDSGYYKVTLCDNTKRYSKFVHRLVAEVYVSGDTSLTVNHKDGNKINNHYTNLEWTSNLDNLKHSFENKLTPRGSKIHTSKFTESEVAILKERLYTEKVKDLAEEFKVCKQTLYDIKNGKYWKHV